MTMQPNPTSDPFTLFGTDPAEMLATAAITMGRVPSDCLLIVDRTPNGTGIFSCSALSDIWVEGGREQLEDLMAEMQLAGTTSAVGMIVLGEGYEECDPIAVDEVAGLGAAQVIATAAHLLPEPLDLEGVWTLGGGDARFTTLREAGGDDVEIMMSPPFPLTAIEETRNAADAVLHGIAVPRPDPQRAERLLRISELLHTPPHDMSATGAPVGTGPSEPARAETGEREGAPAERILRLSVLLQAAIQTLDAVERRDTDDVSEQETDVFDELFTQLAARDSAWDLLSVCVAHSGGEVDAPELVLPALTEDPTLMPCAHLRESGTWLLALQDLAAIAHGLSGPRAASVVRSLHAVLVILHWWNDRPRSAGACLACMFEHDPDDLLAHLLRSLLLDGPMPAWCAQQG